MQMTQNSKGTPKGIQLKVVSVLLWLQSLSLSPQETIIISNFLFILPETFLVQKTYFFSHLLYHTGHSITSLYIESYLNTFNK